MIDVVLPHLDQVFWAQNQGLSAENFDSAVDLSVYLKSDVPLAKAQQLAASSRQRNGVGNVAVISADAALAAFRAYSGFGAALGVFTTNPMPNVLHVRPTADAQ